MKTRLSVIVVLVVCAHLVGADKKELEQLDVEAKKLL